MGNWTIAGYLLRRTLSWFLIASAGTWFLFLSTQLVRIAPVFSGAGMPWTTAAEIVLLLLAPVIGWALLPSYLFAVFFAAGKMRENGELVGMDALGVPLLARLKALVLFAGLIAMSTALFGWRLSPLATERLARIAFMTAKNALREELVNGRIASPIPGITFYAEKSHGGDRLGPVFLEWPGNGAVRQIVAKRVVSTAKEGDMLGFRFENGRLFLRRGSQSAQDRSNIAISFQTFDIRIPIGAALKNRLDFIPPQLAADIAALRGPPPDQIPDVVWRYTFWRRMTAPIGCLSLSLLGLGWAFLDQRQSRGRAMTLAAFLFGGYHLIGRLSETLVGELVIAPWMGAMLTVAALPLVAIGVAVARRFAGSARRLRQSKRSSIVRRDQMR
jgi:lipopolysaccharide export LptBFGC system permease protein LptF